MKQGWIGVDLDGTLAVYDGWKGIEHIGAPILPMVARVQAWIALDKPVKIFTARVSEGPEAIGYIRKWCKDNIGVALEVTNVKDYGMIELWDDRAITVEHNTGRVIALN